MGEMNNTLFALIGSRICHDLISPVGAINNGLELLEMSGNPTGPEIGLIGESVSHASARIRFFRIAFGAAGDQHIGPPEVNSMLRDLYGTSRLEVIWRLDVRAPRKQVRLAFLAILCAEAAMPYGGRIEIAEHAGRWRLKGLADRVNVDPDLWDILSGQPAPRDLQPAQVQFALLPLVASDIGRTVTCQMDSSTVTLVF